MFVASLASVQGDLCFRRTQKRSVGTWSNSWWQTVRRDKWGRDREGCLISLPTPKRHVQSPGVRSRGGDRTALGTISGQSGVNRIRLLYLTPKLQVLSIERGITCHSHTAIVAGVLPPRPPFFGSCIFGASGRPRDGALETPGGAGCPWASWKSRGGRRPGAPCAGQSGVWEGRAERKMLRGSGEER
jgi:hypothetical protein